MNALCCARTRKAPAAAEGPWRGKSAVAGKAQVECILPQRYQRGIPHALTRVGDAVNQRREVAARQADVEQLTALAA